MAFSPGRFRTFEPVVGVLTDALKRTASHRVLDLGSGRGGAWRELAHSLSDAGFSVSVRLSDRRPPERESLALPLTHRVAVSYEPEPLAAPNVPTTIGGLRTCFNAFHHLDPGQASDLLARVAASGEGIVIVEVTNRNLASLAWNAVAVPLLVLLLAPFVGSWRVLAWTYLGGFALPLAMGWDGAVSCLRTYSADEVVELGRASAPGYTWTVGAERIGRLPVSVSWICGLPPGASDPRTEIRR